MPIKTYSEEFCRNAVALGPDPCLVDTLAPTHNGPENARNHNGKEHLHR